MKELYVIDGPMKGTSFVLGDGVTTIGRLSDNDICITDSAVSRHHAKFFRKDDKIFIIDLQSSHGVFVDKRKIGSGEEVKIQQESVIRVGNTVLSLSAEVPEKKMIRPPHRDALKESFNKTAAIMASQLSSRNYTRSLELLLRVSNIFSQSLLDIDELLGEVIDQIFNLLERIDRGAILLLDRETGALKELVSKTRMEDKEGLFSKINYSRTIVKLFMWIPLGCLKASEAMTSCCSPP